MATGQTSVSLTLRWLSAISSFLEGRHHLLPIVAVNAPWPQ